MVLAEFRRAGVPLFLATNKPFFSTGRILEALAVRPFFAEIVCRDSQTPAFASKHEMLCAILERHGLKPAHCLYVGDTRGRRASSSRSPLPKWALDAC